MHTHASDVEMERKEGKGGGKTEQINQEIMNKEQIEQTREWRSLHIDDMKDTSIKEHAEFLRCTY